MSLPDMFVYLSNPSCCGIAFRTTPATLEESVKVGEAVQAYNKYVNDRGWRASATLFLTEEELLAHVNERFMFGEDEDDERKPLTSWAEFKTWVEEDGQADRVEANDLAAYLSFADRFNENLFPAVVPEPTSAGLITTSDDPVWMISQWWKLNEETVIDIRSIVQAANAQEAEAKGAEAIKDSVIRSAGSLVGEPAGPVVALYPVGV